jgi:hypothetical protein
VISRGSNTPILLQFDARHNTNITTVVNSNIAKNLLTLDVRTSGLSSFLYQNINDGIYKI